MRKILVGFGIISSLASCQYVDSGVETLKNNVKNSLELPNLIPCVNLKERKDDKAKTDSVKHFTISSFFKEKFDL